jgi:hypothetical protein
MFPLGLIKHHAREACGGVSPLTLTRALDGVGVSITSGLYCTFPAVLDFLRSSGSGTGST